jgi:hypothetical protein
MRTRVLFLLALTVAFRTMTTGAQQSNTGNGHEWPEHADGYWWLDLPTRDKSRFIQGFTTATGTPPSVSTAGLKPDCAQIVDNLVNHLVYERNDFTHATVGQYGEGLDKFYSDYANKLIPVGRAIFYVRDETRGMSRPDLEKELQEMRRAQ